MSTIFQIIYEGVVKKMTYLDLFIILIYIIGLIGILMIGISGFKYALNPDSYSDNKFKRNSIMGGIMTLIPMIALVYLEQQGLITITETNTDYYEMMMDLLLY